MNIFVAKLNFDTDNDTLRAAFEAFGEVTSAKVVTDFNTGRSKGFGFVEMSNDDEARAAIEQLDNTDLDGRTIAVKEARPKEDRPRNSFRKFDNRGGGGGFGGGGNDRRGGGGSGYGGDRDRRGGWND